MNTLLVKPHKARALCAAMMFGLLVFQFSSPAAADVIPYEITFSNSPTVIEIPIPYNHISSDIEGSFDYDPTTALFSNFIVTWTLGATVTWDPYALGFLPSDPQFHLYPVGTVLNVENIYTFDFDSPSNVSTPQFPPSTASSGTYSALYQGYTGAGRFTLTFPSTSSFAGTFLAKNAGPSFVSPDTGGAFIANFIDYDTNLGGTFFITAVPEPSIYLSLIAGLGLLGFMAQFRKKKAD